LFILATAINVATLGLKRARLPFELPWPVLKVMNRNANIMAKGLKESKEGITLYRNHWKQQRMPGCPVHPNVWARPWAKSLKTRKRKKIFSKYQITKVFVKEAKEDVNSNALFAGSSRRRNFQ